ncbi:serine/threonine-protein kinase [Streptomyces sp. H10-C2]|uniref:serine/threonine-protein kinase n=1 Tax=unclassified Streptomyces TaxID=2593676 RepID=UPI0024BAFC07|nr:MULTISPECIES: serine/threonine-protein kinase [unclassified Streptomyces]MDJ0343468.1 serine/threonine-protein kinase [Streptomyces sp. PH10-H1]MDJ0371548.1 serine/threonine-protein kinase [Streptomyces sp. H10-C2]
MLSDPPGSPERVVAGRFALLGRLGEGGMGTVWRALDRVLQREVALKEVRLPGGSTQEVAQVHGRVLREARALARLQHSHVVTIHQVVDDEPFPWLVMELVAGLSLKALLDQGPLAPARAAGIGSDVLAALRAAHEAGIQHRDVKPANVIIRPDGSAILTDFGIAAMVGQPGLTEPGYIIGTAEFMAPERAAGLPGGPAADLWSLGMLLYVAVEGSNPLSRDTPLATLIAVREDPLPTPSSAGPLAPVLRTLLVRDPALRPSAAELSRMLTEAVRTATRAGPGEIRYAPTRLNGPPPRRAGDGETPAAVPLPRTAVRGGSRSLRRGLAAAAIAVGLAAASVALAVGFMTGRGNHDPAASHTPAPSTSRSTTTSGNAGHGPASSSTPGPSLSHSTTASTAPPISPSAPTSVPSAPVGESSADSWIAQLSSVVISDGTGARDRELAAVRQQIPDARLLRSDDFASLRPGYWVVYTPGPFADGRAALALCASAGRTSDNQCDGRYLSHHAPDIVLICRHGASGGNAGRCTKRNS